MTPAEARARAGRGDCEWCDTGDSRFYAGLAVGAVGMFAFLVAMMLGAMLFAEAAHAQTPGSGFCGYNKVRTPPSNIIRSGSAYQQIIFSTTAQNLTVPTLLQGGPVVGAVLEIQLGLLNFRVDGTAATGSSDTGGSTYGPGGTTVSNPVSLVVCGSDLAAFSGIRSSQSATASTVNIRYYVP